RSCPAKWRPRAQKSGSENLRKAALAQVVKGTSSAASRSRLVTKALAECRILNQASQSFVEGARDGFIVVQSITRCSIVLSLTRHSKTCFRRFCVDHYIQEYPGEILRVVELEF